MELPGFATANAPGRSSRSAPRSTINQTLQLTGVSETVTVTAGAPLVETTTSIRTSTVGRTAIENLPINGRRFQDFVTLTPTVQVDTSRGQLSFAGQRGINSNISIDGADYNQPFFGGIRGGERSNNAFTIPQEAVQEFQVVAAGYSAEFGRSTGGLVNVDHQVGHQHDRRLGVLPQPAPQAGRQERVRPERRARPSSSSAASIGGPISDDRLFFFGAYEQQIFSERRAPWPSVSPASRRAPTTPRRSTSTRSLEETSTPPTTRWALLGSVDYQWPAGTA